LDERNWRADPADQDSLRRAIAYRKRLGQRIPEDLYRSIFFLPRRFQSALNLQVGVMLRDGSLHRLGKTPAPKAIEIPEHRVWWVQPGRGFDNLEPLISLVKESEVPGLSLNGFQFDFSQPMGALNSLTFLDLGECIGFSRWGLSWLRELQELAFLNLERCELRSWIQFQNIVSLTSLQHLNLSHNPILGDRFDLTDLGRLDQLFSLDLGWNQLQLGREFSFIERLQHLSILSLISGVDLGGEIQRLAVLPNLKTLDLSHSRLFQQGLDALAGHETLRELNLSYAHLDIDLSMLGKLPALETLKLSVCDQVTDESLERFADSASLKSLSLVSCKSITDVGLKSLSRLSNLESLDLENCTGITGAGVRSLSTLPNLRRLSLACCRGLRVESLQALDDLPRLQELDLTSCRLSKAEVERLRTFFGERVQVTRRK
jgi:hypothetical protein